MKILYLANIRLPTEKAHGIQIMKMCEAFAELGHTVELVVPTRHNHIAENAFLYYGVARIFTLTTLAVPDWVRFGRIGFLSSLLIFSERARWLAHFWSADVIYSRDALVLLQYVLLGRCIVFEAHTKPSCFARFLARRAHRVVVISYALKEVYVAAGVAEGKIIIASDAVDIRQFDTGKNKAELREQLGLGKDRRIVSYIGKYKTMGKPKGVDDLSVVFPQVLSDVQNAFLLLVGINKEEDKEVRETLRNAHIAESNYKIVTHIPQYEAFLYMKASDVLIMNYPNTPHYAHYMSPLKLFEYMASGMPIVTSDLPTIREVLDERCATFFTPDSTPALAESILFALTHERDVQEKAHRAKQKVAKYTWEKRAERICKSI